MTTSLLLLSVECMLKKRQYTYNTMAMDRLLLVFASKGVISLRLNILDYPMAIVASQKKNPVLVCKSHASAAIKKRAIGPQDSFGN